MTRFIPLLCVVSAVSGFAGCGKKQGPPPPPVRPVIAAKAETRDVPIYLDEIGNCTPFQNVLVQPQVSGPKPAAARGRFEKGCSSRFHRDKSARRASPLSPQSLGARVAEAGLVFCRNRRNRKQQIQRRAAE